MDSDGCGHIYALAIREGPELANIRFRASFLCPCPRQISPLRALHDHSSVFLGFGAVLESPYHMSSTNHLLERTRRRLRSRASTAKT